MSRAAAVLCLLCAVLCLSAPLSALPTTEEVFKMMTKKQAEVVTFQADSTFTVRGPMGPMKSTGRIVTARTEKDGKTIGKSFISMKMTIKAGKMIMTTETKMVNDGRFIWQEMRMSMPPSVQVIKMKTDQPPPGVPGRMLTPEENIQQLRKQFDFKDVAEDVIDGRKMYVLQGTLKENLQQTDIAQMLSRVRHYVDQKDLSIRRMVTYDKQGKETSRSDLTNVKINEKVNPKLFEYTPPPGVEIKDLTEDEPGQ